MIHRRYQVATATARPCGREAKPGYAGYAVGLLVNRGSVIQII